MSTSSLAPSSRAGFIWPVRVYWEDTDGGGVVYYANYLKFLERARTESLRALGLEQQALLDERRTVFMVSRVALNYLSSAKLDDLLHIETKIVKLGRASIIFQQTIKRGETILTVGEIRVACVNADTMRPAALPLDVFSRLQEQV